MILKVNLYPISADLEERIDEAIREAVEKRIKTIEISYGEASANVKKNILTYLNKKEVRCLYSRLEKTEKGWGRVYVHFRHA
ncbi:MAG TPA: DNA mismatch repair protein MutS [Candidatus Omnitrophota bacterium]|nr:Smr/MutS family protein [Candidatus Omnitrophota bacterium]HQO38149.1 DNA mismatch repair protein MutS [Candidatus Omnitrophota bacterium]